MQLDDYIFDSQFLFLNESQKLRTAYEKNLTSAKEFKIKDSTGYLKPETWDTEKFRKRFGRLLWLQDSISVNGYPELSKYLKSQFDCTYLRFNREHSFCKAQGNLPVMSSKVSQHINLSDNFLFDDRDYAEYTEFTSDKEKILEQVLTLSQSSFKHNRFRADKHFDSKMVDSIYRSWITNEIKNKTSRLFVLPENDRVISFVLYKEDISPLPEFKTGFVGLIASSPDAKDKNNASNLLNFVLHWAKQQNTHYVIANTECSNEKAVNFFKRNNFKVTSYLNEYHLWN